MDKLNAMRVFAEIARQGSLTAAATSLGKAPPTVVRTLANLESALGVRLIRRTTRRLSLTDEGRQYLLDCERILGDLDAAEAALHHGDAEVSGNLTITAPIGFGERHVTPILLSFLERYPEIRVDLRLLDRVANLLDEGIDAAVRIGPLEDSSLVANPVGAMRRVVVASPARLALTGTPLRPEPLADEPCVRFRGLDSASGWRFAENRRTFTVRISGPFATNTARSAVDACVAGLGFGRFLYYQVAPFLRDGRLQCILQDFEPPPLPVSIVVSDGRLLPGRLRRFLDHAKVELRQHLTSLNGADSLRLAP